MPNLHTFVVHGPDSAYARDYQPPAELDTLLGGPARWGNNYFDLLVWDGDQPTGYPGDGSTIKYYWHRYYIQTSTGEGFDFSCVNENYNQSDPEYMQSPYSKFTLPPRNYPAPASGGWLTWMYLTVEWSPVMEEWELSSYSTEWVSTTNTGLWLPQYHDQDGHVLIGYSTENVYINGGALQEPDNLYAYKLSDSIGIEFGVSANKASQKHEPEDGDIALYWQTDHYRCGLRFTTAEVWGVDPDTHLPVRIRPTVDYDFTQEQFYNMLASNANSTSYQRIDQAYEFAHMIFGEPDYHLFAKYNNDSTYMKAIQGYDDPVPLTELMMAGLEWDDLDPYISINQFTLEQLKQFMIDNDMDIQGLNDNAMFVEYYLDFYNSNNELKKTIQLDFSNLANTGTDLTGGDGGDLSWTNDYDNIKDDTRLDTDRVNRTPGSDPTLGVAGSFCTTWFLNKSELDDLAAIFNIYDEQVWHMIETKTGLTADKAIDCIIDLRLYPFDVNQMNSGRTAVGDISIGAFDTQITSRYLDGNAVLRKRLCEKRIDPYFNNYLDYEPYTKFQLYVPYIGFIDLAPSLILKTKLAVEIAVDITTGSCCLMIFANEKLISYYQGMIGASINFTSQTSAINSQTQSSLVGALTKGAGMVAAIASGGSLAPVAAVTGGLGILKDVADYASTPGDTTNNSSSGCASPTCNGCLPQDIYLYRYIPKEAIPENQKEIYGKTMGWATARMGTIGEFQASDGIVHGQPININEISYYAIANGLPTPTDEELKLILKTMNEGFYGVDITIH